MLHLLQAAVNPRLGLKESVEHWDGISRMLRESRRKRRRQVQKMAVAKLLLS